MASIGRREQEILTAIVETYISTGEPVGSRTLARRNSEGLSAATIRNVMADLAEAGLLAQPHTSSGRVPSVDGYRYYAEKLSDQVSLKPDDEQTIQRYFHGRKRSSGVHGAHLACALAGLLGRGRGGDLGRAAQGAGARSLPAAGRAAGAGRGGYAQRRGARPGAASSARCGVRPNWTWRRATSTTISAAG